MLCKALEIMHNESSYHNPKQDISWEMWNTPSSLSPRLAHMHAQTQLQRIKEEELHDEKNQVQQFGVFFSSSFSLFVFKVYHQYHHKNQKKNCSLQLERINI